MFKGLRKAVLNRWQSVRRSLGVEVTSPYPTLGSLDFGTRVSNDSAMKLTAFSAGIRYFADNIGSLPKKVTETTDQGGRKEVPSNHYLTHLLNNPNGYTNKFQFWATMTVWLKGWGNAYAIIERGRDGYPTALHQVHPSWVTVFMVEERKWYKVRTTTPAFKFLDGLYSSDDIIHVMEMTIDGVTGIDVVRYNAIALGKSLAQESFAADYYRKGGQNKAVMETDGSMGDEQYKRFTKHFAEASGNFETPLLEYGVKYKQLSVNPISAQLIQSETMSLQDISRILNIPPHMLSELSHATFSNIEHQTIQFVQYSLRPVVKKFEVELESKLVFPGEGGKYNIKMSLDGLLRGDTASRSAYYHNAILDGYMTRNEVRELEGLEPREGLDDFLYPLNTGIVGDEEEETNHKS